MPINHVQQQKIKPSEKQKDQRHKHPSQNPDKDTHPQDDDHHFDEYA